MMKNEVKEILPKATERYVCHLCTKRLMLSSLLVHKKSTRTDMFDLNLLKISAQSDRS